MDVYASACVRACVGMCAGASMHVCACVIIQIFKKYRHTCVTTVVFLLVYKTLLLYNENVITKIHYCYYFSEHPCDYVGSNLGYYITFF